MLKDRKENTKMLTNVCTFIGAYVIMDTVVKMTEIDKAIDKNTAKLKRKVNEIQRNGKKRRK